MNHVNPVHPEILSKTTVGSQTANLSQIFSFHLSTFLVLSPHLANASAANQSCVRTTIWPVRH
jgi:hypothetical protein